MGGGVHLDLIHELDYCLWIFGRPNKVLNVFAKVSKLEIDSFDYTSYTLIYETFIVNINLNYFRKDSKRTIEVVTDNTTYNYDLMTNKVFDNQLGKVIYQDSFFMIDTYKAQMAYFIESINKVDNFEIMNNFTESVEVLKIALNDKS